MNLQRSAQQFKLRVQTQHTFTHKLPLPVTGARLLPVLKLNAIDTQDGPCGGCARQRRMIFHTKVAFEPDDLW
ncbi:hypothetical protein QWY27_14980 [Zwartia sp. IMCC34845]|nr:hypothetical protein [Zwartia vadi]MDN3988897.1 hypothetical protein [Zwartia vadi]